MDQMRIIRSARGQNRHVQLTYLLKFHRRESEHACASVPCSASTHVLTKSMANAAYCIGRDLERVNAVLTAFGMGQNQLFYADSAFIKP